MTTGEIIQVVIAIIMLATAGASFWSVITAKKSIEIARKDRRDDFLPILMIDRTCGQDGIEHTKEVGKWQVMFRNYGKGPAHSIESNDEFITKFSERQLPPGDNYLVVDVVSDKMNGNGHYSLTIQYKDVFNKSITVKYGLINISETHVVLLDTNKKVEFSGLFNTDV